MARPIGTVTVYVKRQLNDGGRFGAEPDRGREPITGCAWVPRTSTEAGDAADTVVIGKTLFCPAGTVLQPDDIIELDDGEDYEIVGEPGQYRKRKTGREKAVIAALQRIEG